MSLAHCHENNIPQPGVDVGDDRRAVGTPADAPPTRLSPWRARSIRSTQFDVSAVERE